MGELGDFSDEGVGEGCGGRGGVDYCYLRAIVVSW